MLTGSDSKNMLSSHSRGDKNCTACAIAPTRCGEVFGEGDSFCDGLVHYKLDPPHAEITKSRYTVSSCCDRCGDQYARFYDERFIPDYNDCLQPLINLASHQCSTVECPSCAAPPTRCLEDDCTGLIHYLVDPPLPPQGKGTYLYIIYERCDRCGWKRSQFREGQFSLDDCKVDYDLAKKLKAEKNAERLALIAEEEERTRRFGATTDEERMKELVKTSESLETLENYLLACLCLDEDDGRYIFDAPESRCRAARVHELRRHLPWLQELFFSDDPEHLFTIFSAEIDRPAAEFKIRSAALGLYDYFSHCRPVNQSGHPAVYGRSMLFRSYYQQIVRMLHIEDCTDWRRTRWEIDNAWLAKDYALVRKLIEHGKNQNLAEASEISALEVLFEYRKLAGPDLDHEDPGTIFGEDFRFSTHEWPSDDDSLQFKHEPYSTAERDLTLDAACIGVPINAPDSHSYGHPIEFLWGILDDRLNVKHWWEAREAIKLIDSSPASTEHVTGVARSYLVCLRAQLLEMAGEQIEAARLYETLTDTESPVPVFRVQMLARKKAALLCMKLHQVNDAVRILDQACASDTDIPALWEDRARAYIAQGDLPKAHYAAQHAASIREKAGMTPEIGYLLTQTEKIRSTEIDKEIKKYEFFPDLTADSQHELRFAVENILNAKYSAEAFINYAGHAALSFSTALEIELREVIFRRWREEVPAEERTNPLLEKADPYLSRFLRNERDPALGDMIKSIRKSIDSPLFVLQSLAKFIRRHNQNLLGPNLLGEFEEIRDAANLKRHYGVESDSAAAIPAKAKRCISAIHPFPSARFSSGNSKESR